MKRKQFKAKVKIVLYIDMDTIYTDPDDTYIDMDAITLTEKITEFVRKEDPSAGVWVDDIEMIEV